MAFAECRLYLNLPGIEGAYKTKLLQEIALVQGTIVGDPATATHALFRHRRQPEFAAITSGRENIRICGPLWLVASLQARELLDPDAHALYEPFPDACVPGVAESPHRRLTITGLEGIERLLAQTALISMGCDLCMQYLRMQTSLIVAKDVHDTASKKAQAARDDKTPLVNLNWALDSLERWHVQPLEPYKRNSVVNIVFRPPAAAGPKAPSPRYVEDSEGGEASNQSPAGAHQARAPHAAAVGGAGASEKLLLAGLDHDDDQDLKTKETMHVAKEINDGKHEGVGDDNHSLELCNAGGVVRSLPEGMLAAGTTTQALDNIRGIVDTLCHETQQRSDRAAPVVFHSLRDGMRQRKNDEHEHRNEGLVDASANQVKATKEASPTPSLSALGATGATTAEVLLNAQPAQEAMTRSFDEDRQIDGRVPQTEVVDDADVAASERGLGGATLGVEDQEGDDDDNHDDGVHSPHAIEPEASDAAPAIARNGDAATEQDEGCAAAEGGGTVERRPRKQRGPTRAPFSQPPMDEDVLPVPEQGSKEGVATAGTGKRKRGGVKSSTRVAASGSGQPSRLGNNQHARVVERKGKEKQQAGMQHGGNNIKKPTKESETTAASRGPTAAAAAAANSQHPAATNKRTTPAPALEEATTKSRRMNPGAGPAGAGAGAGPSKRTRMAANKPHAADQSENPAAEAVQQAASAETSREKPAAAEDRGGPSPSDGMRVALSGLHSDQQRDLRAKLASLGIPCSSTDHAWHNNTHIVAPGLLRNQKCLAALACGAWLVGTSFVEASARAGSLVEEGPHELNVASGSPASFEADVASHWRRRRCNTGLKAFSGLRFAVGRQSDGSATREDLCAIIHAGDGRIVSMKEQADIVVVASEAAGARSALHKSKGALVVTPEYIFKWLTFPHGMLDEHVVSSSTRNAAVIKAERERGDVGGAAADFRTKKQGSARREPSPESSRSL